MSTKYRTYITPLTARNTYGSEIEITDYVTFDGLATIRQTIDSQDYNIGIFTFDDINVVAVNFNGYFNDEMDTRSIFKFSRDLAKVRVVFENSDGDTIVFRGIVNDAATRVDASQDTINFRVLSRNSVLRTTQISAGLVTNGSTAKVAMTSILSDSQITSILTISSLNIDPDYNFTIDDGTQFDNLSVQDGLNQLLFASNSCMLIDDAGVVTIRSRLEDTTKDIVNLYGPYDIKRRQNVLRLSEYNNGKQRMFNAIVVNGQVKDDTAIIETFGYKRKEVTFDFITDLGTEETIASTILSEFKSPKIELILDVPTYVASTIAILDRVSLNWPLRVKPASSFLPVVGAAIIGDTDTLLPYTFGSLSINPVLAFKVIEISQNPSDFITTLKLRQIGKTLSDGTFNQPASAIIGFAIIGQAMIQAGGSDCDKYNPAILGGAQIDCSKVA